MTDYQKVTEEIIEELRRLVGAKNVLTGEDRENYSKDSRTKVEPVTPEVVVKPENTAAVAAVMKLAADRHIPVTPWGAGSGLSGGAVPLYGGISISLEKMNKILEIDEEGFVAVIEPGVTLAELYQAVEAKGLYYPLYPGEATATLGGNVATNAGGMRAVKYGVTRHFVLGLEVVLPGGEVIETGGAYVKCSTGYDLTQLIVGSEGTLAVVTRIMLRLMPLPGKREVLCVPFLSLAEAIRAVPAILKAGILPVGIEWMERDLVALVEQYTGKEIPLQQDYAVFLMIILEVDDDEEFLSLAGRIGEICEKQGALETFIPGSERAKRILFETREKVGLAIWHFLGRLDGIDIVVPRRRITEFTEKAKATAAAYGVNVFAFGHAGDGNLHFEATQKKTTASPEKVSEFFTEVYKIGVALGGTISGEHGLGCSKKGYLPLAASKAKIDLMRRVKKAFDPGNIMNPGKIFEV